MAMMGREGRRDRVVDGALWALVVVAWPFAMAGRVVTGLLDRIESRRLRTVAAWSLMALWAVVCAIPGIVWPMVRDARAMGDVGARAEVAAGGRVMVATTGGRACVAYGGSTLTRGAAGDGGVEVEVTPAPGAAPWPEACAAGTAGVVDAATWRATRGRG